MKIPGMGRPARHGADSRPDARAFTLLELLAAMTVMLILFGLLSAILSNTKRALGQAQGTGEATRAAQTGFDTLRRTLAQATLNSYWGYDNPGNPANYLRLSELNFVSGAGAELTELTGVRTHAVFFQAPLGFADPGALISGSTGNANSLLTALNATGYFVRFGDDPTQRPTVLGTTSTPRYRFRLMQFLEPTTSLSVYKTTDIDPPATRLKWFRDGLIADKYLSVLAENIVALILLPKPAGQNLTDPFSLVKVVNESWNPGGAYNYDSREGVLTSSTRHFLPPSIRVIAVAIDEASAIKLQGNSTTMPFDLDNLGLFRTGTTEALLRSDLAKLEGILAAKPGNVAGNTIACTYRIFETDIPLADSK